MNEYYIYKISDPALMDDKNGCFLVENCELIYLPDYGFGMNDCYEYLYKYDSISNWLGYAWILNREQLLTVCRNNILSVNRFDFDSLSQGLYAIVWNDLS